MKLITAIVRPEKIGAVTRALASCGFNGYSKWAVNGRGRQQILKNASNSHPEMEKSMLYIVVENHNKTEVIDIIVRTAKTGETGSPGDGKIYVVDIDEQYTISQQ